MRQKILSILGLSTIITVLSLSSVSFAETFTFKSLKYIKFKDRTIFTYKVSGNKIEGVLIFDNAIPTKTLKAEKGEYAVNSDRNEIELSLINGIDKENFREMPFKTISFNIKLPAIGEMDEKSQESESNIKTYPDSSFDIFLSMEYQEYLYNEMQMRTIAKAYTTLDGIGEVAQFYDKIYANGMNFKIDSAPEKSHRIYYINEGVNRYGLMLWDSKDANIKSSKNTIIIYKVLEDLKK